MPPRVGVHLVDREPTSVTRHRGLRTTTQSTSRAQTSRGHSRRALGLPAPSGRHVPPVARRRDRPGTCSAAPPGPSGQLHSRIPESPTGSSARVVARPEVPVTDDPRTPVAFGAHTEKRHPPPVNRCAPRTSHNRRWFPSRTDAVHRAGRRRRSPPRYSVLGEQTIDRSTRDPGQVWPVTELVGHLVDRLVELVHGEQQAYVPVGHGAARGRRRSRCTP